MKQSVFACVYFIQNNRLQPSRPDGWRRLGYGGGIWDDGFLLTGWTGLGRMAAAPLKCARRGRVELLHGMIETFPLKFTVREVDDQTDVETSCLKIVDCLGHVLWKNPAYSFQLQKHFVFNDDVCNVFADNFTSKLHREGNLRRALIPRCCNAITRAFSYTLSKNPVPSSSITSRHAPITSCVRSACRIRLSIIIPWAFPD